MNSSTNIPVANSQPGDSKEQATNAPNGVKINKARSVTRLMVGGVEVGVDELLRLLHEWEEQIASEPQETPISRESSPPLPAGSTLLPEENSESSADLLRYALIGYLFETEERLQNSVSKLKSVDRSISQLIDPFVQPVWSSWLLSPFRKRYETWVSRGQDEVSRWISLGRVEDAHSRTLAQKALTGTVDDSIEYFAANPEVQQLVQTQSTGLATEVIEEVRERTVSADTLLEGVARSLLRRPPRTALPEPPPDVRASVTPASTAVKK